MLFTSGLSFSQPSLPNAIPSPLFLSQHSMQLDRNNRIFHVTLCINNGNLVTYLSPTNHLYLWGDRLIWYFLNILCICFYISVPPFFLEWINIIPVQARFNFQAWPKSMLFPWDAQITPTPNNQPREFLWKFIALLL